MKQILKTRTQLEDRISLLIFELGTYNYFIPADKLEKIYQTKRELRDY